jgi:C4-dicarboxylate-specific signal transduction histidine kinase
MGGVVTVTRVDPTTTRATSLTRLISLYMALGALTVLTFAYFGLTRQIVQPILSLTSAAERVAQGGRKLDLPTTSVRELRELGLSLSQMTSQLRNEEEALRHKIEEVERKTRELEAAQASLVRSERLATVGQLSAGLAHEIGNPISALMGLTDLLIEDDQSEEERADFLRRMRKEIERVDRVLSDLLAFARPQERSALGPRRAADVSQAVEDVLALLLPQRSLSGVEVRREVAAHLPLVTLEPGALVQVLLNLVMNAASALDGRGTIEISAGQEGDQVYLRVKDDGPGVATKVRERIFEPFVTTKDPGQGTGLGLSVSLGLVQAAGGTLELLTSEEGALFELRLPQASPQDRQASSAPTDESTRTGSESDR